MSTRIYPIKLPQNVVLPCISFQIIAEPRGHTLDGFASPNTIIQVDAWAKTHLAAHTLSEAIETALDGYSGFMGSLVQVSACLQQAKRELFEPDVDDYRVSSDFSVWWN